MNKAIALYYECMSYSASNRDKIERSFTVKSLHDPRFDDQVVTDDVEVLFAPLGFMVDKPRMDKFPSLKVVVSNTTGIPHIDADEACKRGICISALHDEQKFLDTITPTVEHTIGLMLAAWRRIPACHAAAVTGSWNRRNWGAPRMFSRMTAGLVGYGRIGKKVGEICKSMGMKVSYYDPYVDGGSESLEYLVKGSDVLSLHAVANDETKGLISREILEMLPEGAMVVNTARGELLDTDALLDLLENGSLAAAALDTIDGEYNPDFEAGFGNSRLVKYAQTHDNLVLTPHIGGSTYDAWFETERYVIDKALKFLEQD